MSADSRVRALYLHVPFCARKCAYCDFASWATPAGDPLMNAYAHAIGAQLGEASSLGLFEACETAYVGGGTPTLLGEKDLGQLVEKVVDAAAPSELTCEANPDSLSDEVLRAVRGAGATGRRSRRSPSPSRCWWEAASWERTSAGSPSSRGRPRT